MDQSMIFIKFQKEEYIKDLFAGKVYMNPLEYFVKKELADGDKVVGDIYENCTVSDAYETPFGSPCSLILKNGYSKSYTYCLYGTYIDPDSGIKFEQKEKLKTFGDMALCIYNVDEFLRRVKRAALLEQYELFTDWIMYYDQKQPNTIEMMNNMIIHKTEAFLKRDDYAYQKEYRIVINQKYDENCSDHIELDIGSIRDISEVVKTEDLLSGKILLSKN